MMADPVLLATVPADTWVICVVMAMLLSLYSRDALRRRAARELLRWLLGRTTGR